MSKQIEELIVGKLYRIKKNVLGCLYTFNKGETRISERQAVGLKSGLFIIYLGNDEEKNKRLYLYNGRVMSDSVGTYSEPELYFEQVEDE